MLTQQEIMNRIRLVKKSLADKYSINKIGIFGSFARNDANEDSDIDILVEFNQPIGWEFVDLKNDLEELFNNRVDLVTVNALKPQLKASILNEVIFQ